LSAQQATVTLFTNDPACHERVVEASSYYGLAYLLHPPAAALTNYDYALEIGSEQARLIATDKRHGPITLDYNAGSIAHRFRSGEGRKQPLARAIGLNRKSPPGLILDATGGYGKDAFVLAALGCPVVLVERSPVLACLLEQALCNARSNPGIQETATVGSIDTSALTETLWRMRLIHMDSLALMQSLVSSPARPARADTVSPHFPDELRLEPDSFSERPDVVYLDPMYPATGKSAKVKKDMQALHSLIGPDTDSPSLLEAALGCALQRVVVKRPRRSKPIAGPSPSTEILSPNTRYDVYLVNNVQP